MSLVVEHEKINRKYRMTLFHIRLRFRENRLERTFLINRENKSVSKLIQNQRY